MQVKSQRIARKVRLLTDPNPNFVSLVSNGANQTPFSVVKRAQPQKGTTSKTGVSKMPLPLRPVNMNKVLAKKEDQQTSASQVAILKVEFDADHFTEETATKWLDDNKWENYELKFNEDDNLYVARSTSVTKGDFANIQEVLVQDGIAAYAGQLKDATQKGKGSDSTNGPGGSTVNQPGKDKGKGKGGGMSAKAQKSGGESGQQGDEETEEQQESVIKLDWWEMYQSRGESVADVLKDGMVDGMPPGMDSIMSATMYAVKNVLVGAGDTEEKTTKLAAVGAEMASILGTVYDLYEGANGLTRKQSTDDTRAFVEAYEAQLEAIVEPEDEVSVVDEVAAIQKAGEGNGEGGKGGDKPKDKGKAKKDGDVAVDGVIPLDKLSEAIATAIAKSPAQKSVALLQKSLNEQGKALKAVKEAAEEAVRKAEAAGNRAPTKKGHDNDPEQVEEKPSSNYMLDNLAGFMGVSRKATTTNRRQ